MKRTLATSLLAVCMTITMPAIPALADVCGWEAGGESGGETHTHESTTTTETTTTTATATEERFLVGGGEPELILRTGHRDIKPIQDCVDRSEVDWLAEELKRDGKFTNDILLWAFTDGIWIMQGHHRYVASKLTGIQIWALVERRFDHPANGSFGYDDWTNVIWCEEVTTH